MSYSNFNLEYYRAFLYVGMFLSFTKAAEALCISQPAVSQSIKKLEQQLGFPLFERASDKLKLTDEGTLLFSHVQSAFQELDDGERKINTYRTQRKEYRIGATETALRYYLPPILSKLTQEEHDASIYVSSGTIMEMCDKLYRGEIASAYMLDPLPNDFPFKLEIVDSVQDIVVCGANYATITKEKTYDLRELANEKWISLDARNSVAGFWNRWFFEAGIKFTPSYVVHGTGLMLPLIKENLGLAVIPECFVREDIQSGEILQVSMSNLPKPRYIYLATRK